MANSFVNDRNGAVALIVGIGGLPLLGMVGLAIDQGRASVARDELAAIVSEACQRIESAMHQSQPPASQAGTVQAVLDRRIGQTDTLNGVVATVQSNGTGVFVVTTGEVSTIMPVASGNIDLSGTTNCGPASAGGSPANPPGSIVFSESFESPVNDPTWSWQVRPYLAGWTTASGPGPEIHNPANRSADNRTFNGSFPNATDGSQFAELDSSFGRGALSATTTNSAITTEVWLEPGQYRLSVDYIIKLDPNAGNGIEVFFEEAAQPAFTGHVATMDGHTSWHQYAFDLNAPYAGNFRLGFRATGAANDNGGAIDNIRLSRLP